MFPFSLLLNRIIKEGRLDVIDADGKRHVYGGTAPGPQATIRLHERKLYWQLALNAKLKVGEAWMDGTLTVEDGSTLYDFLDVIGVNLARFENLPVNKYGERLMMPLRMFRQWNSARTSKRNVQHHYDLSGELYDLFLDDDRQYSCAYFANDDDDLETAQANKKRHIAAKLLLEKGHRVLDIGSGWGGLGLYLAQESGCELMGVTLSEEQHKLSNARAADAGLQDRVRFDLTDYREIGGQFDRIVSVGMFEHVGVPQYDTYFRKMRDLLADDGVALLHSIGRMERPGSGTNAWLKKYIFPGGYTPALSETLAAIERAGLYVTDIEILRLHYAKTLRHWYERFMANRERAKALYDERFCRMWEFYLIGCEIAFVHFNQMVFQIQLAKRQDAAPLTRDYVTEFEQSRPTPLLRKAAE